MDDFEVKIDYMSVTFPLDIYENESVMFRVHEMVKLMANYLNVKNFEIAKAKYAQNNYNYQFSLGDSIILRLDGPLNDCYQKTCHLEMKGEGCRDFEKRNPDKTWINFILFLVELNARFKRIDIAIDDYSGTDVTMGWLLEKLDKKFYVSVFRSPYTQIGSIENGLTIQFGSHMSPIQLVIYDKKFERKKRHKECDKAYWVRYEMRFRDKKAESIAYLLTECYSEKAEGQYGTNFPTFAFEQLYRILDIKEENNYDEKSQYRVETDKRWKDFLMNVEKGSLPKPEEGVDKSFESYLKAASPYISMWLLIKYLKVLGDPYLFEIEIYKFMRDSLTFSKQRFQRLNMYLDQYNLKTIDDDMMAKLKEEFSGILNDKEMPF